MCLLFPLYAKITFMQILTKRPTSCLPDSRQQPVTDTSGVFFVVGQLLLKHFVFHIHCCFMRYLS